MHNPQLPNREALARPDDAIQHLTDFQEQADMHGERVTVSRQALDEVLAFVALIPSPDQGEAEYVTITLSRDGTVTSHNAFDADFDEMVVAIQTIVTALQARLEGRGRCPYSHGAVLRNGPLPTPSAVSQVVSQIMAYTDTNQRDATELADIIIRALATPPLDSAKPGEACEHCGGNSVFGKHSLDSRGQPVCATPPVDSAKPGEEIEQDIRVAIWNAAMNGGMGQDLSLAFIRRAMAEPLMIRALAALSASLPEPQLGVER